MSLVLDFGEAGHRRTELDLPWLVNGTLDAVARERVERHLATCSRCRQDESELRQQQRGYASMEVVASAPMDFERLRRRIEGERTATRPRVERRAGGMAWMRWAMAAQVFALALLTTWVLRAGIGEGSYRTLGAERPLTTGAAAGTHRALLMFQPSLTQAQMRQLLQASGARIVDGPNEAGAYLVVLPQEHSTQALRALRAAPGVVLAESVDPGPAQ